MLDERIRNLPSKTPGQEDVDSIVEEAFEDVRLRDDETQGVRMLKLLLAIYAITGTIKFPRGWKRAIMIGLHKAGLHVPSPESLGWYRTRLMRDPEEYRFASPDFEDEHIQELFDDLEREAY